MSLSLISRSLCQKHVFPRVIRRNVSKVSSPLAFQFSLRQPCRYYAEQASTETGNLNVDIGDLPPFPPTSESPTASKKLKASKNKTEQTDMQQQPFDDLFGREFEDMKFSEEVRVTESKRAPKAQPSVAIYRATKEPAKGAAMQFAYVPAKKCIFLTAARQGGPKLPPNVSGQQFDYKNKIVAKLSLQEMAAFLRVLREQTPQLDLFHSVNSGANKSQTQIRMKFNSANKTTLIQIVKRVVPVGAQPAVDPAFADSTMTEDTAFGNVGGAVTQNSVGLYLTPNDATVLEVFLLSAMRDAMGFK
jgi:hypothetical protein